MNAENDTICAVSTPPGAGAIAVLRLSGLQAVSVADHLFSSTQGPLSEMASHTLRYGSWVAQGVLLDEVVVALFRAPRSYTGEDVVEISCHGSEFIQQRILQSLVQQGARLATPGEFTQRAFLNGKMDLSQAEAVADVIASRSDVFHRIAMHQMRGGFSACLQQLRSQLLEFTSLLELELDFSEEDVAFADRKALTLLVDQMDEVLARLIASFAYGNVVKSGVPVAIVGKTNVGKSTLLNALLNEERAIVSDVHGTTRDTIEGVITLRGIRFRFIDTAGIRSTEDEVENMGIQRTFVKVRQARVVLLMTEASAAVAEVLDEIQALEIQEGQALIVLLNKADRFTGAPLEETLGALRHHLSGGTFLPLAAKFREGLPALERVLVQVVEQLGAGADEVVVTNVRHLEALRQARTSLGRVREGLQTTLPVDLLTQDAREVLYYLGTITGEITTQEILGNIFEKFCIGK